MKTLFLLILLLAGCSGWTYNGIDPRDFDGATGRDLAEMTAGFITTCAVHTAGHVAVAEALDKPWHFDGLSEIVDGEMTNSEAQWFARAGFLSQLLVGYVAKLFGATGDFWKGYNTGTAVYIAAYPISNNVMGNHGDDLGMLDDFGADGNLEWAGYTLAASGLNFKRRYDREQK